MEKLSNTFLFLAVVSLAFIIGGLAILAGRLGQRESELDKKEIELLYMIKPSCLK